MLIYRRELRVNRKGLIIWSAIMGLMLVMIIAFYPEMSKQQDTYQQLLSSMGDLLKAFGISQFEMSNVLEYYSIEGYLTVTLFGSIYAVILASSILSKEQSEKTIEFLLAKPVDRTSIVLQKFAALFTNILLFNSILTLTNLILFNIYEQNDFSYKLFFWISFAPFMLQMTLASIGFAFSVFIKKSRTAIYTALGVVFIFYIFDVVSSLSDKLEVLKHLTPFEYTNASDILESGSIDGAYMIVMFFVIIISIVLSVVLYNRKNITI